MPGAHAAIAGEVITVRRVGLHDVHGVCPSMPVSSSTCPRSCSYAAVWSNRAIWTRVCSRPCKASPVRETRSVNPPAALQVDQEVEMPIKDARKEPVKYLWFVGDYAS